MVFDIIVICEEKMKKVGLITLYGNFNFGNRLQNYAVQTIFEKHGLVCSTIVIKKTRGKEFLKKTHQIVKSLFGDNVSKRKNKFDSFNSQNIHRNVIYKKNGLIPVSLSEQYDIFCVGSDQVWNPEIRKKERWNFFLQFAKPSQKMCIAPSIGVTCIPTQYREEFAKYFCEFTFLSCREKDGAEDIAKLSQKDCKHIIDPTLAITRDEWLVFSEGLNIEKKYVVIFFLGDIHDFCLGKIYEFSQKNGYEIINLSDTKSSFYSINPQNFVWLIDKAQMVFTDSFHAAAFSINMNTPFYVFDRHEQQEEANHMSSRIQSLAELFSMSERYCKHDLREINEICDFTDANKILIEQRHIFNGYVERCIKHLLEVEDES